MCGRFTLTAPPDVISQVFGAPCPVPAFEKRYNIAPTQSVMALLNTDGENRYAFLRWGLIPFWAKGPEIGNRMINARAETLPTKNSFKHSFRKQRCLIAADGFYEWRKEGKRKVPVYIALRDRRPFGFAGLWSSWESPDAERIDSCTIITTSANELLKPVHDRMPVILGQDEVAAWLDSGNQKTDALSKLLKPYPSEGMEYYEVSTWVNSPAHEGERCIEREGPSS